MPSKLADRTDDARGDESFGLIEPGSPSRPRRLRMVKQHVRRGCRRTPIAERDPASARISSARPAGNRRLRIACENCSLWPFLRRPALIRSGFSSGARSA